MSEQDDDETVPIAEPILSDDAKRRVTAVLESGMIASGEVVETFEAEFSKYVGTEYAVATSSGTTALHAMLEAAGIESGDRVVTTSFSFISSANAIRHAGARPIFADIDEETYNIDVEQVRTLLKRRKDIVAILPVHLYGLPANMDELQTLAEEHDVLLFEDAAQAHGATYDSQQIGSLSDAAAFSFYPTKNMTTGEGGMITTDDPEIAHQARQLINHGRSDRYHHEVVGYNYRMTNIQAAIGRSQLERLPQWVRKRQTNARQLTEQLEPIESITVPTIPPGRTHSFHQYTINVKQRDEFTEYLENQGVGCGIYYPTPIPDQPPYSRNGAFPVARRQAGRVVSLPVHPRVSDSDIETIANAVRESEEV